MSTEFELKFDVSIRLREVKIYLFLSIRIDYKKEARKS